MATVGRIHNHPDSPNIIPGRVYFTVDIRSWEDHLALRAWQEMEKGSREIGSRRGCGVQTGLIWKVEHVELDSTLLQKVREKGRSLGYRTLDMQSGAGHDAGYMAMVAPTAMIFVPSVAGRSHVEVETTSWEHCEAGANLLLHCALASAQEGDGKGAAPSPL